MRKAALPRSGRLIRNTSKTVKLRVLSASTGRLFQNTNDTFSHRPMIRVSSLVECRLLAPPRPAVTTVIGVSHLIHCFRPLTAVLTGFLLRFGKVSISLWLINGDVGY